MTELTPEEQKELFKSAIKEWMNEQMANVGWWFFKTIAVAGAAYVLMWYWTFKGKPF